ncbi:YqgQ family protein [Enterococcus sp. BWB1-3]|uniref:YqgQ family protein n=1 Tax=unclassified Enterococcus TaxID=2608891 RepID=UPI001921412C|nr:MULTISPECIES: YqgQ family protein [unclassified Enterococcus]MBL1230635.1 YqgQ family protein [Enterococcus sp. BWB1-3]MCB5952218.1 YqgQ family protein [Enterococcus sp. BWT-B8]MCB5956059.1 YqgQ family protein [Enterococcus sp. CWB-B31]
METLYDVQQLFKRFGMYIYVGARIYDIELMAIELKNLYEGHLIDRDIYLQARRILSREHKIEENRLTERGIE